MSGNPAPAPSTIALRLRKCRRFICMAGVFMAVERPEHAESRPRRKPEGTVCYPQSGCTQRHGASAGREISMNRTSVAAGVPPPGIPGSQSVSRSISNKWPSMHVSMQAIARVETGSLTPTLSQGERESLVSRRITPKSLRASRLDSFRRTTGSILRNPRRLFSFSLREKAGMRAARLTPRAPVQGPHAVHWHTDPIP
jgi:hypothetical protein